MPPSFHLATAVALYFAAAVCPGGGGTGPDCDQCPQNMILMSNGICKESCGSHQMHQQHSMQDCSVHGEDRWRRLLQQTAALAAETRDVLANPAFISLSPTAAF
jgi:hypothetical protein